MVFDHVSLPVADYDKSKAFYEKALAPLGLKLILEYGKSGGFAGADEKPCFWIGQGAPDYWGPAHKAGGAPVHVAFSAKSKEEVDAFHEAAIAAGGKDHGAPGLRPQYHPGYYGAFVLDPDGHNIEAVIHILT
jgi:catechol 2,3-dioxygenase-like lactoylglutathione lyase family enzyme